MTGKRSKKEEEKGRKARVEFRRGCGWLAVEKFQCGKKSWRGLRWISVYSDDQ